MKTERQTLTQDARIDLKQPQISILVPVYNVEPYLEQCLDSLSCQSFSNIEIICVDDGSTDQSGAILDRYASVDPRFRVIHKKNTGYGNSMNVALDHAQGRYIAILESDDFAKPDMLQKLYTEAETRNVEVVKGTYLNYRDRKAVRSDRVDEYPKNQALNCDTCPTLTWLPDTIWSCLYRRDFLLEHAIRFHETPGASYQDISFALQVWLQVKRASIIEDALLYYRRDNPLSSMNNPSKVFCVFDEYQWVEEKMGRILEGSSVLCRYFAASKYRDYLNHYYRMGAQYQYALLVRLEQSLRADREKGWIEETVFIPSIWEQLCELENGIDVFFKKTARAVPDTRLTSCRFENNVLYASAFLEKLKEYPQVYIYGAGQVGKRLAKAIREQGGQVDAFLVTRLSDGQDVCMDLPVMEVQEARPNAARCAVVVAVTEWSQYELYVTLKNYGFLHIFRTDEAVRTRM